MSDSGPMRAEHVFIWGDTGSGKTTVMREVHDRVDIPSIVVNHGFDGTDDESMDDFRGFLAAGPKRCKSIIGEYDDWSDVRIVYESKSEDPLTTCARAVKIAREMPVPCQIVIDECDEVMPNDGSDTTENPVKWAFRKGRGHGVKVVAGTQTPVGLDQNALKSATWWACVGEPSGYHEQFLNRHQWIPEEELPNREFQYVVWDKSGRIVWRGESKPKYA